MNPLVKKIIKKEIIIGLFKEALFLDSTIQIISTLKSSSGKIIDFSEENDQIMFFSNDSIEIKTKHTFSFNFNKFRLTFDIDKIEGSSPFYIIKKPDVVFLINDRVQKRFTTDGKMESRVLVKNKSSQDIGKFRISNISFNGLGGELKTDLDYNQLKESSICGSIFFNCHWLNINGDIRTVRLINENPKGTNKYFIGLNCDSIIKSNKNSSNDSIPRPERFKTNYSLDFNFNIYRNKKFKLNLINASVSGFLVSISDPEIKEIAISSIFIEKCESSIKARLIDFHDDQFRYQITEGNQSDRLNWLKEVSTNSDANVKSLGTNEDEILALFCQSGAMSEGYIKSQKDLSQNLLDTLSKSGEEEPWIYRLIDTNSVSNKKAFASAIKNADNCWCITDIVSDRYGNNEKMSKDFFPRFINSFKDFLTLNSPCPSILISWVSGHKFYIGFEKYIKESGNKYCLAKCNMHYTRNSSSFIPKSNFKVSLKEIIASDYNKIQSIQSKLSSSLKFFSSALDFSINRIGSAGLKESFSQKNLPFKRSYIEITYQGFHYLAIFTLIPEGLNPGRYVDSIYILDLQEHLPSSDIWNEVKQELYNYAATNGYSTHAIRRLSDSKEPLDSDEIVNLTTYLLHPDSFNYFNKK